MSINKKRLCVQIEELTNKKLCIEILKLLIEKGYIENKKASYIDINLYEFDDETLSEIKNIVDKQDDKNIIIPIPDKLEILKHYEYANKNNLITI